MEYRFGTIALTAINPNDPTFRISTSRDKPSIFESISTDGMLVPPALKRQGAEWIVVSGFRRIYACMQAGHRMIAARLLADHLVPLECLRLAIIENSSQRTLNMVESARAVRRLRRLCDADHDLTSEMARLGLTSTHTTVARLERLGQLGETLQNAIVDGFIGPDVALTIGAMPTEDQNAVLNIFTGIAMSAGKQKDILNMAQDIAGRDRKSLAAVLQSDRIRAIGDDPERDRNMKSADIRSHLRKLRYPHLFRTETRCRTAIDKLKLGSHMRIDHPEGFEGKTYTLSLRFKSIEDLTHAHRKLGHAIQNPAIKGLFPD